MNLSPRQMRLLRRREVSAAINAACVTPQKTLGASGFTSMPSAAAAAGYQGGDNSQNSSNAVSGGVAKADSIITNLKKILEQKPAAPDPSDVGSPDRRVGDATSPGRSSRQRVQELLESVKSGQRTISRTGGSAGLLSPRAGVDNAAAAARIRELEMENKRLRQEATVGAGRFVPQVREVASYFREEARPSIKQALEDMNDWLVEASAALTRVCQQHQAKYAKERRLRKALNEKVIDLQGNIRVFARVRPLSATEKANGDVSCIRFLDECTMLCEPPASTSATGSTAAQRPVEYEFDRVFTPRSTQEEVYEEVSPLVQSAIDGYNVCIFAYGQTGSGKTFTMEGSPTDRGVNYRALEQLFETLSENSHENKHEVTMSVVEIYNEQVRDLLLDKAAYKKAAETSGLDIRQNAKGEIIVPGLTAMPVTNVEEVTNLMRTRAFPNRQTSATMMNAQSSRSHLLLFVNIHTTARTGDTTFGRLVLIDLAGSERVKKSMATGQAMTEAQNINSSLSALGDVISALKGKEKHIPYRNSKLTYLLQDCLGGSSKCLMFCNVSPATDNYQETSCSLKFAQRVRNVQLGVARKQLAKGAAISSQSSAGSAAPAQPAVDPATLIRVREEAAAAKEEVNILKREIAAFEDLKRQHAEQVKALREKLRQLEKDNESLKTELAQAQIRHNSLMRPQTTRAPVELSDVARHRRTLSKAGLPSVASSTAAQADASKSAAVASTSSAAAIATSITTRRGTESFPPAFAPSKVVPTEADDAWDAANNASAELSLVETSITEQPAASRGFNGFDNIPLTPAKGLRPGSALAAISSVAAAQHDLELSLEEINTSHEVSPGQKRKSMESDKEEDNQHRSCEKPGTGAAYNAKSIILQSSAALKVTPFSPVQDDSLLMMRKTSGNDAGKRVCFEAVISKTLNESTFIGDVSTVEGGNEHGETSGDQLVVDDADNLNVSSIQSENDPPQRSFSMAQPISASLSGPKRAFNPSTRPASAGTTSTSSSATRVFRPIATSASNVTSTQPAAGKGLKGLSQPVRRPATSTATGGGASRLLSQRSVREISLTRK